MDNELARRYAPRIRKHAARYARRLPRQLVVADLVSAGFSGLVDACRRFDNGRTHSFEAYLDHRIRGAILDELRHHDPLTRDQRSFARRHAHELNRLSHQLGRTPTERELASALKLSLATMRAHASRASESAALGAATSGDVDLADAPGDGCERPDTLLEMREQRTRVFAAIERLPPRHRLALRMYYDEEQTLRQIAAELGVTESRVSQIHSEAIAKLRVMLAANP